MLVVEDEDDARELLKTVFASYGATVAAVASAPEAMSEIERSVPHVIVSDIGMPLEDGFSLMQRIRAEASARGR